MVGLNYDFGYEVKDIKSGEVTKYSEVLCGVCDHMASVFIKEGNTMSKVLQETTKLYVKWAQEIHNS